MISMTQRQADAYRFIADYIRERGYAPEYSEIGAALDLASQNAVHRLVHALIERRYLRRIYRWQCARNIEVVDQRPRGRRVGANLRLSDFPLNPALIALESCDRADERRSA